MQKGPAIMTDGDTAYRAARACRRISASGSHTAADPSGVLTPKALGNDIKALRPDHANHPFRNPRLSLQSPQAPSRSSFDYQRLEMAKPSHPCVFRQIAAPLGSSLASVAGKIYRKSNLC